MNERNLLDFLNERNLPFDIVLNAALIAIAIADGVFSAFARYVPLPALMFGGIAGGLVVWGALVPPMRITWAAWGLDALLLFGAAAAKKCAPDLLPLLYCAAPLTTLANIVIATAVIRRRFLRG